MADADLDVVIRQLARQLHTGLMTRAKERRDRFNGLAAKAKGETGARFKMMAKATMEQATAAAKRLQMSADNVADSYARSMRLAASTPVAVKVEKTKDEKPAKKAAKAKKAKARKAK